MDYTTHDTLLARLSERAEDPAAWMEFHDRYADVIRGFARRYGMQAADCDDVVQEVLLALSKSMKTFRYDPERGRFRSYLKTLAVRSVFRNSRQKRRPVALGGNGRALDDTGVDPEVEENWEAEWRQHHVRLAMRRLEAEFSERDRMAFTAYAVRGRPASETAEDYGMSLDQVYQAKSRILRRMKEMIAEQTRDEG